MNKASLLFLSLSMVVMAKPSLKTSVVDKSQYEVNTNIVDDTSRKENNDENTTMIIKDERQKEGSVITADDTPIKNKPVFDKEVPTEVDVALEEVEVKPKRKVVSSHDEIKNSYTGGSKIRSGYNKNIIEEIRKSVPHGDDSKFHGGD
jgi:hypothetical protein